MKRVTMGQVESIWGREKGWMALVWEMRKSLLVGGDLEHDGLMTRSIQLSKEVRPRCANQKNSKCKDPRKDTTELDILGEKRTI